MVNPYEAPSGSIADPEIIPVARPRVVTAAIVFIAVPLAVWTLLGLWHFVRPTAGGKPWSVDYTVYVVILMIVPIFLLAMIVRRRNWARIALASFYGLDFLWRIFMLATIMPVTATSLSPVVIPSVFRIVGFVLLWLPRSNKWFAAENVVKTRSITAP